MTKLFNLSDQLKDEITFAFDNQGSKKIINFIEGVDQNNVYEAISIMDSLVGEFNWIKIPKSPNNITNETLKYFIKEECIRTLDDESKQKVVAFLKKSKLTTSIRRGLSDNGDLRTILDVPLSINEQDRHSSYVGSGGYGKVSLAVYIPKSRPKMPIQPIFCKLKQESCSLHPEVSALRATNSLLFFHEAHPKRVYFLSYFHLGRSQFFRCLPLIGSDDNSKIVFLMTAICSYLQALKEVEKCGIYPWDLKDGNVSIAKDGYVSLIDYDGNINDKKIRNEDFSHPIRGWFGDTLQKLKYGSFIEEIYKEKQFSISFGDIDTQSGYFTRLFEKHYPKEYKKYLANYRNFLDKQPSLDGTNGSLRLSQDQSLRESTATSSFSATAVPVITRYDDMHESTSTISSVHLQNNDINSATILVEIKTCVQAAAEEYRRVHGSVIERHGETGQRRANALKEKLLTITTLPDMNAELAILFAEKGLFDFRSKGNYHEGSLKTLVLTKLKENAIAKDYIWAEPESNARALPTDEAGREGCAASSKILRPKKK